MLKTIVLSSCGWVLIRSGQFIITGSPGIPPGHLIVDSAAGQALIGEAACVKWEQKLSTVGLRGVRVHCKMMTP